jgi:RHS repeat-associated protein
LVSTYQYDPYGNLTSSTGSVTNPWRFAGGYFDSSTGLYKFGTRYYNPGFGRWSQQDPLRGQLNDPTLLNRYLYAGDDPVNFTDPSGRDAFECVLGLIVGWIAGFLAFVYLVGVLNSIGDAVVLSIIAGTLGVTAGVLLIVGFAGFIALAFLAPIVYAIYECLKHPN